MRSVCTHCDDEREASARISEGPCMMRRAYATHHRHRGSREVRPFRSGRAPRSPEPSFGGSRGSMRQRVREKISGGEGSFFPANRNPPDFLLFGSIRPTLPQRANWREGGARARRPRAATRARASSGRARQTCLRSSRGGTRRATSSGARRTLPPPSLPPPLPRARRVGKVHVPSRICRVVEASDGERSPDRPLPPRSRDAQDRCSRRRNHGHPRQSPPSRAHPGASTRAARRPSDTRRVSVPSGCHVAVGQPRPDPRLNLHA